MTGLEIVAMLFVVIFAVLLIVGLGVDLMDDILDRDELEGEEWEWENDPDPVHNPNHYTHGGIETIDYIKAKLTREEYRGFLKGNIIKYISREAYKNGDEDIEKADVYTGWLKDLANEKQ